MRYLDPVNYFPGSFFYAANGQIAITFHYTTKKGVSQISPIIFNNNFHGLKAYAAQFPGIEGV